MGPGLDQVAIAIEHARLYRQTQRREHEARVGLAVQEVRTEILQMQTENDWSRVVRLLRLKIRAFIDYSACGINLVSGTSMNSSVQGMASATKPNSAICLGPSPRPCVRASPATVVRRKRCRPAATIQP